MEEVPKTLDMGEHAMAKRQVVDQFVNMIAEARSYGLGVVLCEQIPTRLARDAIKNCHTRIVHKLTSPDDIELMAAETNSNDEQKAHIAALQTGEAVIAEPSSIVPAKVRVIHDPDYYPEMNRVWTDADVKRRMLDFYAHHPEFAKTPTIPVLRRRMAQEDSEQDGDRSVAQIRDMVQTKAFRNLYEESLAECVENPESTMLEEWSRTMPYTCPMFE